MSITFLLGSAAADRAFADDLIRGTLVLASIIMAVWLVGVALAWWSRRRRG